LPLSGKQIKSDASSFFVLFVRYIRDLPVEVIILNQCKVVVSRCKGKEII